MRQEIDQFFSSDVAEFTRDLAKFEERIGHVQTAQPDADFEEIRDRILMMLGACDRLEERLVGEPALLKETQVKFREAIQPWFSQSWFMDRGLTKPRGYPGDYVLLSAIYERRPLSPGIGGYLDLFFLQTTLGKAVCERMQAARDFLLEELSLRSGEVTVLNVASGACREYVGGLPTAGDVSLKLTCVDSDQAAIDYVKENVLPHCDGLAPNMVCYNALRMSSAKGNINRFGRQDVIYSIGLFDYIPNKHLIPMMSGLRETLNDNGTVYFAFKDCRYYTTTEYQWLTDWFFLERTEDDVRQLFTEAGYDATHMTMTRDSGKSIINFVVRSIPSAVPVASGIRLATAPQVPGVAIAADGVPSGS